VERSVEAGCSGTMLRIGGATRQSRDLGDARVEVVLKPPEYHFEYHFWVSGRNEGIVRVTPTARNPFTPSRVETPRDTHVAT
jgi:hypothetical protein